MKKAVSTAVSRSCYVTPRRISNFHKRVPLCLLTVAFLRHRVEISVLRLLYGWYVNHALYNVLTHTHTDVDPPRRHQRSGTVRGGGSVQRQRGEGAGRLRSHGNVVLSSAAVPRDADWAVQHRRLTLGYQLSHRRLQHTPCIADTRLEKSLNDVLMVWTQDNCQRISINADDLVTESAYCYQNVTITKSYRSTYLSIKGKN